MPDNKSKTPNLDERNKRKWKEVSTSGTPGQGKKWKFEGEDFDEAHEYSDEKDYVNSKGITVNKTWKFDKQQGKWVWYEAPSKTKYRGY